MIERDLDLTAWSARVSTLDAGDSTLLIVSLALVSSMNRINGTVSAEIMLQELERASLLVKSWREAEKAALKRDPSVVSVFLAVVIATTILFLASVGFAAIFRMRP